MDGLFVLIFYEHIKMIIAPEYWKSRLIVKRSGQNRLLEPTQLFAPSLGSGRVDIRKLAGGIRVMEWHFKMAAGIPLSEVPWEEASEGLKAAEMSYAVPDYPLNLPCKIFKLLPLKLNVTVIYLPRVLGF